MLRTLAALPLLLALGCGARSDAPPQPALPPPPPPAPVVREEAVIAHGIGAEDSIDVFREPSKASNVMGLLRKGARFDVVETREAEGETWHRVQKAGWVRAAMVRVRADGEPTLGFVPFQPRRDQPMPYNVARVVAREGVPVYRRPPPRGSDPEQFVDRKLREGYFFTVDKWVNIYDRQLHRGIRYWFVPREGTDMVTPPEFEGIPVTAQTRLPFLWVTDPTAKVCPEALAPDAPRGTCSPVERHRRLEFRGEQRVQGGQWYESDVGFVPSTQVSRVDRIRTLPEGLHQGERWIHVDLRNQFAALYEGEQMTFVTLISSGDDEHPTPTGTYRVQSKHVSATMDSEDNLSSAYFIQDVPWVQYFSGGYALHAAFWHDRFGLRTSHGCVNLSPKDARRFFEFTRAPELPPALHAVFAAPGEAGTLVHVTR